MTTTSSSTSKSRLARQVVEDMDYLIGAWPALVTLSEPTSTHRRPPGRHEILEAQRIRASILAMQERIDARQPGAVKGTGPIPAPAALGVLDLLARFVCVAADVADTVTQAAGVERPPEVQSSWTDPRPYLQLARVWLTVADGTDDRTMPWVSGQLHPLADAVAGQLGEVHDGQVLDAVCPWCGGRTERSDGQRTLVVYARQSRLEQQADTAPTPRPSASDGPVIVCRGVNCQPPPDQCGARVGDHPAWPEREWEWLAKRLHTSAGKAS